MWSLFQMEIAEQHQRDLRNEADKWRMVNQKENYQPNPTVQQRSKRKRK